MFKCQGSKAIANVAASTKHMQKCRMPSDHTEKEVQECRRSGRQGHFGRIVLMRAIEGGPEACSKKILGVLFRKYRHREGVQGAWRHIGSDAWAS